MWRDNGIRYGRISMGFHWFMALIIIGMIISGLVMVNLEVPLKLKFSIYQLHKSFGFTILLLVFARLSWRIGQQTPSLPSDMPAWQKRGAKASHHVLYVMMFLIPLSGWFVVSASTYKVDTFIFGLFKLPHLPVKNFGFDAKWLDQLTKNIHFYLAVLMGLAIVAHIGAAIKHHIIEKDDVLTRMLPEKKS